MRIIGILLFRMSAREYLSVQPPYYSSAGILGPQLVIRFWEVAGPLRRWDLTAEAGHWKLGLIVSPISNASSLCFMVAVGL